VGAVEHLKTLCCLGLPPESAMIAVTPLLHEIIPHGSMGLGLVAPDATMTNVYAENPATGAIFRERRFIDDPSALASLWIPAVRAVGIGWTLHRQGRDYLESAFYGNWRRRLTPAGFWTRRSAMAAGRSDLSSSRIHAARVPLRWTTCNGSTGSGPGSRRHCGGPHPAMCTRKIRLR
jgi:hypothetical protein